MKKVTNQHGDVILERVDEIPKKAKQIEVKGKKFLVEKGEGVHTHEIIDLNDLCDKIEVYDLNGQMFVKVKSPVEIDHEEHGKQKLEIGIYKKNIEREFDYEKEIERKVID